MHVRSFASVLVLAAASSLGGSLFAAEIFRFPNEVTAVVDLSPDGAYAAGDMETDDGSGARSHAFVWSEQDGVVDIHDFAADVATNAIAISDDGTAVAGNFEVDFGDSGAFVWVDGVGMVDVGSLGGVATRARDLSADGSVVVGMSEDGDGNRRAFRYDVIDDDLDDLGTLGGNEAEAFFVSDGGGTVIGRSRVDFDVDGNDWHLFRWTSSGGMDDLGSLGGADLFVLDISDDASVIVGFADDDSGEQRPFYWSQGRGIIDVGTTGGGSSPPSLDLVSRDGTLTAGEFTTSQNIDVAFRFEEGSGPLELPLLSTNGDMYVTSIDGDGRTIGGPAIAGDGFLSAYLWTAADGTRSLANILDDEPAGGDDPGTLDFIDVLLLSDDGRALIAEADASAFAHIRFSDDDDDDDDGDDDDGDDDDDDGGSTDPPPPPGGGDDDDGAGGGGGAEVDFAGQLNANVYYAYYFAYYLYAVEPTNAAYYSYLYAVYSLAYHEQAKALDRESNEFAQARYTSLLLNYNSLVYAYQAYGASGSTNGANAVNYIYTAFYYLLADLDSAL